MLTVIIETDNGAPYQFRFDGEASQFKQLWETAEARALGRDILEIAARVTDAIFCEQPCEDETEKWGRNAWEAYAILRILSDKSIINYPSTFEMAARRKISVTIRRGTNAAFSIGITKGEA